MKFKLLLLLLLVVAVAVGVFVALKVTGLNSSAYDNNSPIVSIKPRKCSRDSDCNFRTMCPPRAICLKPPDEEKLNYACQNSKCVVLQNSND